MKKMLSEITNRAELLEQLADLLAELDKYPSRVQRDIWALIDEEGKTYDDCLEYAENHPEVYAQLEDVARDAIDGMSDVYKEAAERYFFDALANEGDAEEYA